MTNIKVALTNTAGKILFITECTPTGYFLIPVFDFHRGEYDIKVIPPHGFNFSPNQFTVQVNQKRQVSQCQHDIIFMLTGFTVTGNIVMTENGSGSSPDSATSTTSTTSTSSTSSSSDTAKIQSLIAEAKISLRSVESKDNDKQVISSTSGQFIFTSIVPGKYIISVEHPSMHVLNPFQTITTSWGSNYQLSAPFKLAASLPEVSKSNKPCSETSRKQEASTPRTPRTITSTGRVINSAGLPIADVSILLDGKHVATTNANGQYTLNDLSISTHTIKAQQQHYFFSSLQDITPTSSLESIILKNVSVCGSIELGENAVPRTIYAQVSTTRFSTSTDALGRFCFESPVASDISISPDSKSYPTTPALRVVSVDHEPVLNVAFTLTRVTVNGKIICLDSSCDASSVKVSMSRSKSNRVTIVARSDGTFAFIDVLPGSYRLVVHQENWCWISPAQDIKVSAESNEVVEFTQSGFVLAVSSSQPVALNVTLEGAVQQEFPAKTIQLVAGSNRFCLAKSGVFKLVPSSCHKFEQTSYLFDTQNPQIVELHAIEYEVSGSIVFNSNSSQPPSSLPIIIRINQVESLSSAMFFSTVDNRSVFSFSFFVPFNARVEIIPRVSHPSSSHPTSLAQTLLFHPQSRNFVLSKKECMILAESFIARPGTFVSGKILPPVAGVHVHILSSSNVSYTTLSNDDGSYYYGPLPDTGMYSIQAFLENYKLTKTSEFDFASRKLSSVKISIMSADNKPVSGVLLSLTAEGFRSNNNTENDGIFSFHSLLPGIYYLRPLLKEYSFIPSFKSIVLDDGAQLNVSFAAIRVAFSVFGRVHSLNGEPERNVIVEAIGSNDRAETAQTDLNGYFRLRGLEPRMAYSVQVQPNGASVQRVSPMSITISVNHSDVHDIHFVSFRSSPIVDVTGCVSAESDILDNLEVEVMSQSSRRIRAVHSISRELNFFDFGLQAGEVYILRVHSKILKFSSNEIYAEEVVVDLRSDLSRRHITLHVALSSNGASVAAFTTLILFSVVMLLFVAFYKKQSLVNWYAKYHESSSKSKGMKNSHKMK